MAGRNNVDVDGLRRRLDEQRELALGLHQGLDAIDVEDADAHDRLRDITAATTLLERQIDVFAADLEKAEADVAQEEADDAFGASDE